MKLIIKNKMNRLLVIMTLVAMLFFSCKYDVRDMLPKPKASFTVTPAWTPNKYILTSTSENAFRFDWDKSGTGYVQGKQVDTVYFPYLGNYTVKLFVFGHSGVDSTSQLITVAANDPTACMGTQLGFITSC